MTTFSTSRPFCSITAAPTPTASVTEATSPVIDTHPLPPIAMARLIVISCTGVALTAASAASITEATLNASITPSDFSWGRWVTPLIAGNTAGCKLGITKLSTTVCAPTSRPACTPELTAATSPPTNTMYLPGQIVRLTTMRRLAVFNIVSAISNPLAMLDVSTMPTALPFFMVAAVLLATG